MCGGMTLRASRCVCEWTHTCTAGAVRAAGMAGTHDSGGGGQSVPQGFVIFREVQHTAWCCWRHKHAHAHLEIRIYHVTSKHATTLQWKSGAIKIMAGCSLVNIDLGGRVAMPMPHHTQGEQVIHEAFAACMHTDMHTHMAVFIWHLCKYGARQCTRAHLVIDTHCVTLFFVEEVRCPCCSCCWALVAFSIRAACHQRLQVLRPLIGDIPTICALQLSPSLQLALTQRPHSAAMNEGITNISNQYQ